MDLTTIRYSEPAQAVRLITLNRPEQMNTFNTVMLNELAAAVETAALDETVRVVVITGEGRAFSAGADVKSVDELLGIQQESCESRDVMKLVNRLVLLLREAPKPVLAAVNGVVAGASTNFVLACDMVIASENARFAENFVNIGLIPDGGGTFLLPAVIGCQRAAEIFFSGKILTAPEALKLGIYNRVVPQDELPGAVLSAAQDLVQKPAKALAAVKALLNQDTVSRLRRFLDSEAAVQRRLAGSADAREGIAAFIEKRKPVFQGC